MSFLYPSFLWLLIPLFFLFSKKENSIMIYSHLVVLTLILLALSRPVIENGVKENIIESKNIIIALDVSYSMRATDIQPNRYDFAKETIEIFLKNNPKTTVTLIAFTQNPLLLSPPTTDYQLIIVALKTLNPNYILTKGTSLKNLFAKVATLKTPHKNLLLISDGGEESSSTELKEQLNKAQINLTILALGTIQGTSIKTTEGRLLKDKEGHLVISAINPMLKELTNNYNQASSSPEATAKALESSLNIVKKEQLKKWQHSYQEFYQFPLFLALLLFFIVHTKFIKYLFILLALFGVSAHASILDGYHLTQAYNDYQAKEYKKSQMHLKQIENPSLESVTILANSNYQLQEYKTAIKLYKSIRSTSIKTKQSLYYNIANAYAKLQEYSKAKAYYTKALQLGDDKQSQYNLELIMFKENKKKTNLGIANPKSQSSQSSKSENQEDSDKNSENKPSSASGSSTSGTDSQKKSTKKEEKKQLILDSKQEEQQQPLSSKVYELINKGYIYETKPW
jgi:Ca-activated chloride channel family protein